MQNRPIFDSLRLLNSTEEIAFGPLKYMEVNIGLHTKHCNTIHKIHTKTHKTTQNIKLHIKYIQNSSKLHKKYIHSTYVGYIYSLQLFTFYCFMTPNSKMKKQLGAVL